VELAKQLAESAETLLRIMTERATLPWCPIRDLNQQRQAPQEKKGKHLSANQLSGKLKQCYAYLKKNVRDVPLIEEKTGFVLTPEIREKVIAHLADIIECCELLRAARS
jgi:hypothetical protein